MTTKMNTMVCCISLAQSNLIRLISLPAPVIPVIRSAIQQGWGTPIEKEKESKGTFEFQLKGKPWYSSGKEAVMSQRLITHVLKAMAQNGWNLLASGDMAKLSADRDTLFFGNADPDPDPEIFSVSFNMSDRIRVIDTPLMMPHVKEAVISQWLKGIHGEREFEGSLELTLKADPWKPRPFKVSDKVEQIHPSLVVAQIIANLSNAGFKLYGAIDMSGQDTSRDMDSYFFRKVGPSWQQ